MWCDSFWLRCVGCYFCLFWIGCLVYNLFDFLVFVFVLCCCVLYWYRGILVYWLGFGGNLLCLVVIFVCLDRKIVVFVVVDYWKSWCLVLCLRVGRLVVCFWWNGCWGCGLVLYGWLCVVLWFFWGWFWLCLVCYRVGCWLRFDWIFECLVFIWGGFWFWLFFIDCGGGNCYLCFVVWCFCFRLVIVCLVWVVNGIWWIVFDLFYLLVWRYVC